MGLLVNLDPYFYEEDDEDDEVGCCRICGSWLEGDSDHAGDDVCDDCREIADTE